MGEKSCICVFAKAPESGKVKTRLSLAVGSDGACELAHAFLQDTWATVRGLSWAVIGPCEDGGFFLLGLRRCPRGLLSGIPWSQRDTFSQTLAILKAAGMDVRLLDAWFDVDRPQDLERLRAKMAAGEVSAPQTKETLNRLAVGGRPHPVEFSVIIPVLNECELLPGLLEDLQGQESIDEVIVVDGGSTDGTLGWLQQQDNVRIIQSPAGRGVQLNAGARAATGDTLLFLHADSCLPGDAGDLLRDALTQPRVAGGCFCVRFAQKEPRTLSIVAAGINLRTRLTRSATGDQAIFVRREVFERIGGFRDWPLFEDVDFVQRMKAEGKFKVLPSRLAVSARRHLKHGIFRTVFFIYALRLGFWAGIHPLKLANWYKHMGSGISRPTEAPKEQSVA